MRPTLEEIAKSINALILDAEKAETELHNQFTGWQFAKGDKESVCDIPGTPFQCVVRDGAYKAIIHRGVEVGDYLARYVHDLAETVAREEAECEAAREENRKVEQQRERAFA